MWKGLMTKLLIFVLLFLPSLAFSLEVSAVQKQQDGDYKITFCKLFKIENIALVKKSFGSVLEMPREIGGYKNLAITSKELDLKIKNAIDKPKNMQYTAYIGSILHILEEVAYVRF